MKFTPETLLQIYLDGSFTEEAQAEFDRLMRKDPFFAEKVTQALAERLGPVPDSMLNSISDKLDQKREDLWKLYKPSPTGRYFKLAVPAALVLVVAAGFYFSGRLLIKNPLKVLPSRTMTKFTSTASGSHVTLSEGQSGNKNQNAQKTGARLDTAESTGFSPYQAKATLHKGGSGSQSQSNLAPQLNSGNEVNPATSLNQTTQGQPGNAQPKPSLSFYSAQGTSTGESSGVSGSATTVEGNSLRVVLETDKTQNIVVTVYDSKGQLVRSLYSGVLPAGEHYLDWDGKDELGNVVQAGDYTVILDLNGKKMSGVLKILPGN